MQNYNISIIYCDTDSIKAKLRLGLELMYQDNDITAQHCYDHYENYKNRYEHGYSTEKLFDGRLFTHSVKQAAVQIRQLYGIKHMEFSFKPSSTFNINE